MTGQDYNRLVDAFKSALKPMQRSVYELSRSLEEINQRQLRNEGKKLMAVKRELELVIKTLDGTVSNSTIQSQLKDILNEI